MTHPGDPFDPHTLASLDKIDARVPTPGQFLSKDAEVALREYTALRQGGSDAITRRAAERAITAIHRLIQSSHLGTAEVLLKLNGVTTDELRAAAASGPDGDHPAVV